jgi:hypothetical protein
MGFLTSLIDAGQLGGWVRAGVASLFGAIAGVLVGPLAGFQDPAVQTAVGVVISTIIVGIWSQIAKKTTPTA